MAATQDGGTSRGLLYLNTVWPRVKSHNQNTLNYWRWGKEYDGTYDLASVVAALGPEVNWWDKGWIGGGEPTEKFDRDVLQCRENWRDYFRQLTDPLCPNLSGFPKNDQLIDVCSTVGTHLDVIPPSIALAIVIRGYLSTMHKMHTTYGTPLVEFSERRFLKLLPNNKRTADSKTTPTS